MRGGARHLDEYVDHGDNDLRLLFARELNHCEDAQKNRGHYEKRCEFGTDEGGGEPPGGVQARSVIHLVASWIATRPPSASSGGGVTMILSPAVRPERTSHWSSRASPSETMRSRAVSPSTTYTARIWPRSTTADGGTSNAARLPMAKPARPNIPDRRPSSGGRSIFTVKLRVAASTEGTIS